MKTVLRYALRLLSVLLTAAAVFGLLYAGGAVSLGQGSADAVSAAFVRMICDDSNIPYQIFVNHSDEPGGSTLGNISNSHVSINTADIGLAQLAMHSSFETAGIKDLEFLRDFAEAFYSI